MRFNASPDVLYHCILVRTVRYSYSVSNAWDKALVGLGLCGHAPPAGALLLVGDQRDFDEQNNPPWPKPESAPNNQFQPQLYERGT